MRCEWDERKNESNLVKHGLGFELAKEVFRSPFVTKKDNRKDYGEKRMIALGVVEQFVLLVVYTMRGDRIRIISARRANEEERRVYYGYLTRGTTEDPWSDEGL